MRVARLISSIIPLFALQSSAFIITPLTDFTDFREPCVVDYVSHRLEDRRCAEAIARYKESFIATVADKVGNESRECIVNQVRLYNASEVLLKAIAYNYDPGQLVTLNSTCDGIVKSANNVSVFSDECGYRATILILSGQSDSLRTIRHCLNDLFRGHRLDKVVLFDASDGSRSEIGARHFGMHAVSFVEELIKVAAPLCGETSSESATLERLYDEAGGHGVDELEEIFHELSWIDLFGFTQPSRHVERCIIDEYRRRFANQALDTDSVVGERLKELSRTALACLEFF